MKKQPTLAEIIQLIPQDKLTVQYLDECAMGVQYHENDIKEISFGTTAPLNNGRLVELGIVLWIDRESLQDVFDYLNEDGLMNIH